MKTKLIFTTMFALFLGVGILGCDDGNKEENSELVEATIVYQTGADTCDAFMLVLGNSGISLRNCHLNLKLVE